MHVLDNTVIRKVSPDELDQLIQVGKQTFAEAFSHLNTAENMKNYLENGFSKSKMDSELSNKYSEFYFAVHENEVIGYLKINYGPAQTEIQDNRALEIERVYVLKDFQRKKVGQKLCNKAIELAKLKDLDYVWLGVWEENPGSIKFYEDYGFVAFDKHIFKLGNDEQTDIMMKLKFE